MPRQTTQHLSADDVQLIVSALCAFSNTAQFMFTRTRAHALALSLSYPDTDIDVHAPERPQ